MDCLDPGSVINLTETMVVASVTQPENERQAPLVDGVRKLATSAKRFPEMIRRRRVRGNH